jgi:hypothetical protein
MASPFDLNIKAGDYPKNGTLIFGSDYGHSNFVTPMARFAFYDNLGAGQAIGSPIIFMRMSGSFTSALQNGYSESQNIFGEPTGSGISADFLHSTVKGGVDALYKQLVGGGAGAASFIASAGQSGKAQYEFLTRRVLNTFQQLIYQGPTFRRFQLPFVMKPTSLAEAEIMTDIIKTFRIASSAKGQPGTGDMNITAKGTDVNSTNDNKKDENKEAIDKENAENTKLTVEQINSLFPGGSTEGSGSRTFSFGYPDMCKFQIVLQRVTAQGTASDTGLAEVFGSEYCVIENVQVDYGSQNKMVFFSSDGTNGKYYPSEVTLTIGLRETSLPLAGQIADGQSGTRTIF